MNPSPDLAAQADRFIGTTWSELHIFTLTDEHLTLPSTTSPFTEDQRRNCANLFTSRDYAFRAGIFMNNLSFAVHQYETTRGIDLVYGRAGDALSGCGACVARITQASGQIMYAAVCYKFPSLSANAVSKLINFAKDHLGAIPQQSTAPVAKSGLVAK